MTIATIRLGRNVMTSDSRSLIDAATATLWNPGRHAAYRWVEHHRAMPLDDPP